MTGAPLQQVPEPPSCDVNTTDWGSGAAVSRLTGQTISTTGKTTAGAVAITTAAFGVYLSGGGAAAPGSGQTWTVVGWLYCTVARTVRVAVSTWNGTSFVATTGTQADTALTVGDVYLSTTPGQATSTQPTGSGQMVQRVGFAGSATSEAFSRGAPTQLA